MVLQYNSDFSNYIGPAFGRLDGPMEHVAGNTNGHVLFQNLVSFDLYAIPLTTDGATVTEGTRVTIDKIAASGHSFRRPVCQKSSVYCFCGIFQTSTDKQVYMVDTSVPGYSVSHIQTTYLTDFTKLDVVFSLLITASDSSEYQIIDFTQNPGVVIIQKGNPAELPDSGVTNILPLKDTNLMVTNINTILG